VRTVLTADWTAIQRREPDRFNAWIGGELNTDGDMTLMLQLEGAISKPSKRAASLETPSIGVLQ